MSIQITPSPLPRRSRISKVLRWLVAGVVGLVLALALFHPVENWRGRRAWERCRRELAARGEVLDWPAYIPAQVSDEKNIFKAPKMAEWFVGRETNELVMRLDPKNLDGFLRRRDPNTNSVVVAKVDSVSSDATLNLEKVDGVLRHFSFEGAAVPGGSVVYVSAIHESISNSISNGSALRSTNIPLIVMEDVPLIDAITNLARQANLSYSLDSKINFRPVRLKEGIEGPPDVSISWQDVSAEQALSDLLAHYNLAWLIDPKTRSAWVTIRDPAAPRMRGFPTLQEHLSGLIQDALHPSAAAAQGFTLIRDFTQIKPARIALSSVRPLSAAEIREFLLTNSTPPVMQGWAHLRVEALESNSFRIVLDRSQICTAAEFLAWSDQFQSDFDLISDALQRPYARMDGDYQQPFAVPIPNYRSFRLVAQTLAQRAQCHLLLAKPEQALRELTQLHNLARLLEVKSSGRPVTLVAAMVDVAVVGIYANVIADGLRMHAWHERELAVLEEQLAEVKLIPIFAEALRFERTSLCRVLEDCLIAAGDKSPEPNRAAAMQSGPGNLVLRGRKLGMPRGWVDQNLVSVARLEQSAIDSLDLTNNTISVERVETWEKEIKRTGARFRPYAFFAAVAIPDYSKAIESVGRNQTLAGQALVACALERYLLKMGSYPTSPAQLVPQFVNKLPPDVIDGADMKYRRLGTHQFLLYSIGWNDKDDGGVSFTGGKERDWVWAASRN